MFNAARNDANNALKKSVSSFMEGIGAHSFAGRKTQLKYKLMNHSVANVLAMNK